MEEEDDRKKSQKVTFDDGDDGEEIDPPRIYREGTAPERQLPKRTFSTKTVKQT